MLDLREPSSRSRSLPVYVRVPGNRRSTWGLWGGGVGAIFLKAVSLFLCFQHWICHFHRLHSNSTLINIISLLEKLGHKWEDPIQTLTSSSWKRIHRGSGLAGMSRVSSSTYTWRLNPPDDILLDTFLLHAHRGGELITSSQPRVERVSATFPPTELKSSSKNPSSNGLCCGVSMTTSCHISLESPSVFLQLFLTCVFLGPFSVSSLPHPLLTPPPTTLP